MKNHIPKLLCIIATSSLFGVSENPLLANSTDATPPAVCFPPVDAEPLCAVSANALILHDKWQMKEEAIVGNHGDQFSSPDFKAADWYPAAVPTTALATLVRNGVYPDPIIGMNMMKIPDVNEVEN